MGQITNIVIEGGEDGISVGQMGDEGGGISYGYHTTCIPSVIPAHVTKQSTKEDLQMEPSTAVSDGPPSLAAPLGAAGRKSLWHPSSDLHDQLLVSTQRARYEVKKNRGRLCCNSYVGV